MESQREAPWAASGRGHNEGEEEEEGPQNEVNGREKGARWMWGTGQRRLRGQSLGEEEEEEDEEEEEENNNNSSGHQEDDETEERTEGGEERGREDEGEGEEEEEGDEDEEMDQDSDEFEHSAESGREEEDEEGEGEGEEGLRSPSLRNNVSTPNNNLDSSCTHQSSSNKKVSTADVCVILFFWNGSISSRDNPCTNSSPSGHCPGKDDLVLNLDKQNSALLCEKPAQIKWHLLTWMLLELAQLTF